MDMKAIEIYKKDLKRILTKRFIHLQIISKEDINKKVNDLAEKIVNDIGKDKNKIAVHCINMDEIISTERKGINQNLSYPFTIEITAQFQETLWWIRAPFFKAMLKEVLFEKYEGKYIFKFEGKRPPLIEGFYEKEELDNILNDEKNESWMVMLEREDERVSLSVVPPLGVNIEICKYNKTLHSIVMERKIMLNLLPYLNRLREAEYEIKNGIMTISGYETEMQK